MATLKELAYVLRSKNAGPFYLTFDIIFQQTEFYDKVRSSKAINAARIAELYKVNPDDVQIYEYDKAESIKVTIPRLHSSGDILDNDIFGCAQHVPLMDIIID